MTELTLKVNHAAKTVQTTGRVAVGEDVALNLVMDEEVEDLAQLRVRLRFMGRDVAVFPFPGSADEWTEGEAGEDEYTYTGIINLNTVQLNALFAELGDGAVLTCAVVVDQVSNDDGTDDYNVLYGKGALRVWNWGGDLSVTPDVDEAPAPVSLRECLEGKIDKVVTATGGNIAVFTTNGGVDDGGMTVSNDALASSSTTVPTSAAVKTVTDALDAAIQTKANASALANLVTTTQLATKADASAVNDLADDVSDVAAELEDKVDKEDGKGLSKNNFTDELKAKLDGVAAGATNVTVDAEITEDSGNAVSSGAVFDMKEHLHQKINAVYTKTEVDAIVAAVKTGSRQVVESLDSVTDPQPLVIYMVAKASAQTSNVYDEYIWLVSEGVGSWEKIGDTEVDLSGYVQKETGKGLSSNDYTTEEKQKLAGVEAGAQKNVTPTAPSTDASAVGKPADAKATGDALAGKQATISDLETIRSGAEAGATAVQAVNGETPTDGNVSITGVQIAFGPGVDESITSKINDVAANLRYAIDSSARDPDPETGAYQLDDRTVNYIQTSATAIVVALPAARTDGRARDFFVRLTSLAATGADNVSIAFADPDIVILTPGAEMPQTPLDAETILYFSEIGPNEFLLKGETVEVTPQGGD